jgi:hypothetical protein
MGAVAAGGWVFHFLKEEVMASTFTRRQALAGSCIGAALFLAPGVACATTRYAVVSIANETRANMTLSYRWGTNDEWHQIHVGPGEKRWWSHKFKTPNENRAPPFYLRFDSDTSSKRFIEPWKLVGRAAEEESFELGNKYAFRYDGPSKRYIEIFDLPG